MDEEHGYISIAVGVVTIDDVAELGAGPGGNTGPRGPITPVVIIRTLGIMNGMSMYTFLASLPSFLFNHSPLLVVYSGCT